MKNTKSKTKTQPTKPVELPDFKDLKVGSDGYRETTTVFDSEFAKFTDVGQKFEGKYVETIMAGKKGEEKPCALFQEKGTNKSFLIGNASVMSKVQKYGQKQYRIEYLGKQKSKTSGFRYSNFKIDVK